MAESTNRLAGRRLIEKAIKLDGEKDYSEALRFYQEGIEFLIIDLQRSNGESMRASKFHVLWSYIKNRRISEKTGLLNLWMQQNTQKWWFLEKHDHEAACSHWRKNDGKN